MEHLRKQAKAGRASKLARFGGMASDINRVKKGMPSRDGSAPGYATGGEVGGDIGGAPSRPNLAKPGRKMGKGKGQKGTNITIVVAGGGGKPPGDGPAMAGPPPGGLPMPPHPMPMPPPGAGPGGPPMPPMRKHGGAVGRFATGGRIANLGKYAHGGKVKRADGGEIVEKRARGPGELDEGAQRDYLKAKAKDATKNNDVKTAGGVGLVGTGLGTTLAHVGSRFGRPGRIGGLIATGLGLGALSSAGKGEIEKKKLDAEAAEFDKADNAERKRGGSVSRMKMKKR